MIMEGFMEGFLRAIYQFKSFSVKIFNILFIGLLMNKFWTLCDKFKSDVYEFIASVFSF